jgi:hypothetical protein
VVDGQPGAKTINAILTKLDSTIEEEEEEEKEKEDLENVKVKEEVEVPEGEVKAENLVELPD